MSLSSDETTRCNMRVECLDVVCRGAEPICREPEGAPQKCYFLIFFFFGAQASPMEAGNTYSLRVNSPYKATMETAS